MSTTPFVAEPIPIVIMRFAQEAHLRARQHADLLRDRSLRAEPSDGPHQLGEQSFIGLKLSQTYRTKDYGREERYACTKDRR